MAQHDLPITVGVRAATRLTGLGRSTLYLAMAAGTLPFIKVGRRRLIRADALDHFLRSMERSAPNREAAQ